MSGMGQLVAVSVLGDRIAALQREIAELRGHVEVLDRDREVLLARVAELEAGQVPAGVEGCRCGGSGRRLVDGPCEGAPVEVPCVCVGAPVMDAPGDFAGC